MKCALESPIHYLQNKILTLGISPFYRPKAHSKYRKNTEILPTGNPYKKMI
jgi:hypothetical protein